MKNDSALPSALSANTDKFLRSERFLRNLQQYIADGQKGDILYEYQKNIVHDTVKFLDSGARRGYIEAPTGTGKTVLFVTLAEALSYQDQDPPRILVVTPTKDLVRQTQGGSKGDKGFAGFAPDLTVGTFYSDTPSGKRSLDNQVTITTYASLSKLASMREVTTNEDGTRSTTIVNKINQLFDVIFLDEGHKALGENSRDIIQNIDDSKIIIGFTATPEYTLTRSLELLLPHLIHRLDLKEAILLGMLSPVIPVAAKAPESSENQFTIGALGEYETKSLKQLIYNSARNEMVANIAARFIRSGNTPIIACIPGDNMAHPHVIADLICEQTMVDPVTGATRQLKVQAVTGAISASTRQNLYTQLENGEIDGLAYIDVLTEGWDSQRVNVIVNARPTRSLVSARQRMGRILRTKADGRPAVAFDIVDELTTATAPQVSMADIFNVSEIKSQTAIGSVEEQFKESLPSTFNDIFEGYEKIDCVKNLYTEYAVLLETLPKVARGEAKIEQDGKIRTFATPERLAKRLGADDFYIEYLSRHYELDTRSVRNKYEAITAYDEDEIHEYITRLPESSRPGYGQEINGKKYISFEEFSELLKKKKRIGVLTDEDVRTLLREPSDYRDSLAFTKRFRARTHRGVSLYVVRTMIELSRAEAIVASLDSGE